MFLLVFQAIFGMIILYWSLEVNDVFPPIPVLFENGDRFFETVDFTYFDTRAYISSYSVGMAFGYALLKTSKRKTVSKTQVVLSLVALIVCIFCFNSVYNLKTQESRLTHKQQLLFASTIRFFFLSSFVWLFHSLFLTSDAIIMFCKKKIFTIGSRFSFSCFMIHTLFISFLQSSRTQLSETSAVTSLSMYFFVLIASLSSAYLIMIFVEYPFGNLLIMTLKGKKKRV